ncbi:flagellar filament capping protein FliD [Metasolibacillus meyeri]|uniref:Flagellar hook-associated protein 2 n=1 Tax=Metasolibacillus meyeri TaxID=1071052 RepID=A0AAW9NWU9_9BACL|nr:flagellar filament capping protein FliD [Metasolibacillus meyeri]MEC1178868.1 flagellar filament capping protein FliD [Metasolibacillus meyeri]
MVMRIGGLASGMDIDDLVNKLMQAERAPLNKAFQKKQVYEWQRDAYRNVNTKLKAFDTFLFDKMILSGKMNQKTATSSNENLVSVKANPGASGNIVIGGVSQLASAAQAVGTQTQYTGSTKLSELGLTSSEISLKSIGSDGRLAADGTKIAIGDNMTVDDLVKKINDSNAGVTALFEGGKLSLTAKNSGSEKSGQGEIVVDGGLEVFNKLGFASADGKLATNGKNAMFEVNGIQTERSSNTFTISGYEMTLKQTFNGGDVALKQKDAATLELQNAQIALGDETSGLTKSYIDAVNAYFGTSYSTINDVKNATLPESPYKQAFETAYNNKFSSTLTEHENSVYKDLANKTRIGNLSDDDIVKIRNNDVTTLKGMDEFKNLSEADLTRLKDNEASLENFRDQVLKESDERLYNSTNKKLLVNDEARAFLNSMQGKTTEEITDAIDGLADGEVKTLLKATNVEQLQFLSQDSGRLDDFKNIAEKQIEHTEKQTAYTNAKKGFEAGEQRVQDAQQSLTNAENVYNNTPTGGATVAPVTMQATADTKAAKEQIVEFVTKYNEMIDEFNTLLKENKYRDYAPLTDDQRKDMSESEQKLWDEKAKSGLLRNDSLIRDGMAQMRATFMSNVAGLGDTLMDSLAEIGITTSKDMKESGKLVIDEKKLDAALSKDPDQVHKIFNQTGEVKEITDANGRRVIEDSRGIAYRLRSAMDNMTKGIERKAGREGMTDQTHNIGRSIVDSNKRIETLQAKLKMIEARYWKQFGAMEAAINKANQQSMMFFPGMSQ